MSRILLVATAVTLLSVGHASADAIHEAVVHGDVESAKQLITDNPELVSLPDSTGNLPLHLAALNGQPEIISLLLFAGADIEAGDRENTTALGAACLIGQVEAGRMLVKAGASVTKPDDNGMTPLLFAAQGGSLELMELLLAKGAPLEEVSGLNSNVLHLACYGGHSEMATFLLDRDFDINAQNERGYTPVYYAALGDHADLVRLLAVRGADLELQDGDGITPLCVAGYRGKTSAAGVLIELGANVNAPPNRHGHTPLAAAIWFGHTEAAIYMMDHGADVQYRRDNGETLLHTATQRGYTEIAAVLIERGLDINVADNFGGTPLNSAVWGQPEMVRWLIDHGAEVNQLNDTALAPLVHAVYSGDTNTVGILLESGANVNCRHLGETAPLLAAISRGQVEVTEMLLDAGADVSVTDGGTGQTALHSAALTGREEIVLLVLDHGAEVDARDDAGFTALAYAIQYAHKPCADLLIARGADATGMVVDYSAPAQLTSAPAAGSACVWYLGHSGWALRTQNHLLILDYFSGGALPDVPCIRNGRIDPEEIAHLDVTVFSSHEHGDHYDTTIFAWREQVPSIRYILGHEPVDQPDYTYIPPRESRDFGDLKVSTIYSTDAGVGYMVEVDGLVIFHAGDHAAGSVDLPEAYTAEIDYIAATWPRIDMAFMPMSGCSLGMPESVKAGVVYALDKLTPRLYFPQHMMDNEHQLAVFAEELEQQGVDIPVYAAGHRGDMCEYARSGDI